ncbi:MAG: hypothetical protein C7B45_08655 [Sulfobacillus acidophilus]|uniref:Uncharacterized protein n=1 Tax=Sulfobacillus acidophilus TaxID=53633 RepID=A0A2T2WI79_9FIRM|nr:MAG: hypothetical protein C7B45_08655 [Sulfobacillus acidophilus]
MVQRGNATVVPAVNMAHSEAIWRDLDHRNPQGSSAVAAAFMVAALLLWPLPRSLRPQDIFKAAPLAHFSAQLWGFLEDVAVSVFGGLLHYQRVDPEWLYQALSSHPLPELIGPSWPGLEVQTLDARWAPR